MSAVSILDVLEEEAWRRNTRRALGFLLVLTLLRALATLFLWNWFVAPLGVPTLDVFHALGLVLFLVVFTFRVTPPKEEVPLETHLILNLAITGVVLLVGWALHFLI